MSKVSLSNTSLFPFSPVFSSKTCAVLYFTFRLLIHVEVFFFFTFCFEIVKDSQEVVKKLYR